MKKMEIKGKVVTTNLNTSGADTLVDGNDKNGLKMILPHNVGLNAWCSDKDFVNAIVEKYGFNYIRLAKVSTMVRGLHDTIAYCKNAESKKEEK